MKGDIGSSGHSILYLEVEFAFGVVHSNASLEALVGQIVAKGGFDALGEILEELDIQILSLVIAGVTSLQ